MAIAPNRLFHRQFLALEQSYTQLDTQLHALGVGAGCGDLDDHALSYVYDRATVSLRCTAGERGVAVLDDDQVTLH